MSLIELPDLSVGQLKQIRPGARILVVSDYPSEDSVRQGRPFSGTSGSILAQCMSNAGISISSCSICYVFGEPHTAADLHTLWTPKGGFTSSGIGFLGILKDHIEEAQPTIIAAVSELALQALTRCKGIEKWRGSILGSSLMEGMKVIPTIHPRESFRRYLLRYHIAADFRKIERESYDPETNLPKRDLRINPTFREVLDYLDLISKSYTRIAADIECSRRKRVKDKLTGKVNVYGKKGISCISLAVSPYLCMSIPFNNEVWTLEEEVEVWKALASVLTNPNIEKIYQNGAYFDMVYLLSVHGIYNRGFIHDTMIKQNINYPDFPKSLAFLTSIYTDEPYYKDDGKQVDLTGQHDKDKFYIYNAKDSAVDFEINTALDAEIDKYNNRAAYNFSQALIEPLIYMQCRGIRVDREKLDKYKKECNKQLIVFQKELDALCGQKLNVSSPMQTKKYFYETLGFHAITKNIRDKKTGTRTTTITTDNKAMTKIARLYNCEQARRVKQIRALRKLIGTYLEIPFDEDGRLRCAFKQSTNTFRLASETTIFETGMNMQNLPKLFKEFLIADEGMLMFQLDKAQAEWVASAYIFGDANMIQACEERVDVHCRTAKMMFGILEDAAKKEDKLLGTTTDVDEIRRIREEKIPEIYKYNPLPSMSCRQAGKKSNHSFNYGLSAQGFSNNYDMELQYSKRCYSLYHAGYSGIRIGHEHVRSQLANNRTLTNLFGWKRRFLDRMNDDLFKAAYSFNPQSTVGRNLNEGIISSYQQQYDHNKSDFMAPVDMLNQVHDSLEGQYPLSNLRGMSKALIQMRDNLDIPLVANGRTFIIRTDCKVGFDLKNMSEINLDCSAEEVESQLIQYVKDYREKIMLKLSDALISSEIDIESLIEETLTQLEEDLEDDECISEII